MRHIQIFKQLSKLGRYPRRGDTVVTAATTSTFRYELIDALAESRDYLIFLMKKRYAQPLDKRTLIGGTVEEFKRFLEEKTGKTFRHVK